MTTATQHRGLTIVMSLLAVLAVGCASRSSQDQLRQGSQSTPPRDSALVRGPFLSPQMQSFNQELRAANTQARTTEVQSRLKDLESTLQQTVDRVDQLAVDFRKTREELERVRLEQALERHATERKVGGGVIRLEEEPPAAGGKPDGQSKAQPQSGEPKQRLKDLLDQIQGLLERQ